LGTVEFVLEMILKNVGMGVVPRDVAAPLLASGALRQVKTRRRELSDSIWLSQIRGFSHEPIAARLIEEMIEAFQASKAVAAIHVERIGRHT
jgi:DNA-binding transcriptional LysR family regulator